MGKQGRRRKRQKPDQYFITGHIEYARFGQVMVGRNRATSQEHAAEVARLAALLPEVVNDINMIVARIARRVASLPPGQLLHRAWWEFAGIFITEGARKVEESGILRMIDYVQSVIVSVKASVEPIAILPNEDWLMLQEDVRALFEKVTVNYQFCRRAAAQQANSDADMALEDFRYRLETFWMHVRGKRYHNHEHQALEDLIAPHSDELEKLFGIDAAALIAELDKILRRLTSGIGEAMEGLLSPDTQKCGSLACHKDAAAELFGLSFFDVEKMANLPTALLDEMTLASGEDSDFFAPGDFAGWPLRVWPVMKRPFVELQGRVYCFDVYSLFDNIYRVLQRAIVRLDPTYQDTWNKRQKEISEELPFRYLKKILPSMRQYQSVYYNWHSHGNKPDWHECDGLVIYDDHLFVVEVKAGSFASSSPATDFMAHFGSLKSLLLNPASQGSRLVDYLKSAPEVPIFDAKHKLVANIKYSDYSSVTVLTVSIDAFTEFSARANHLKEVGIDLGDRRIWSLALDDLRVYADLFDNPLTFLHFSDQRLRAAASSAVDVDDEIAHLGLYLSANNYALSAREMLSGNEEAKLTLHGYRSVIDQYYLALAQGDLPALPRQKTPPRIAEIIRYLAGATFRGRSTMASFLLDADGPTRDQIDSCIEASIARNKQFGRSLPVSFTGDRSFTVCTYAYGVTRDAAVIDEYGRAAAITFNERSRVIIELEYGSQEQLQAVHWRKVGLIGLSNLELTRLEALASRLKKQRRETAAPRGKVGRNNLCSCGSGRKCKRCCGA